jgi:hypothetical protein
MSLSQESNASTCSNASQRSSADSEISQQARLSPRTPRACTRTLTHQERLILYDRPL